MNIEDYRISDIDSVIKVWREATVIEHPFLSQSDLDRDEELIRNEYMDKAKSWCAFEDDKFVGFISLFERRIVALFVSPDRHGKGIGRQLLEFVVRKYGSLSVEVFSVNERAVRFYSKNGFVFVREEPNPLYPAQTQWLMAQKGAKT